VVADRGSNVVNLEDVRAARQPCRRCRLWPCACQYIAKLEGGELSALLPFAKEAAARPLPHRPPCPCPTCYSIRLATWRKDDTG
jgi:hypothetical protein